MCLGEGLQGLPPPPMYKLQMSSQRRNSQNLPKNDDRCEDRDLNPHDPCDCPHLASGFVRSCLSFIFLVSKFSFVVIFFDRSPHSYDVASCMDSYKVLKRTSATYSHSENETLLLQRTSLAIAAISHHRFYVRKGGTSAVSVRPHPLHGSVAACRSMGFLFYLCKKRASSVLEYSRCACVHEVQEMDWQAPRLCLRGRFHSSRAVQASRLLPGDQPRWPQNWLLHDMLSGEEHLTGKDMLSVSWPYENVLPQAEFTNPAADTGRKSRHACAVL